MWRGLGNAPRMSNSAAPIQFSVVVPFYNEEASAGELVKEITTTMSGLGVTWEALFVNDGSKDRTESVLLAASKGFPQCRIITHVTNGGQAAGLMTGFANSRGEMMITLDGDGQNDPADIPALIKLQKESGADMVVGIRRERNDSQLRRWMSRVANRVRGRYLRDGVDDSGCALKVFRRDVVKALIPIRTLYSFMPAMAVAGGFKVVQTPVRHRARTGGVSNYNLKIMLWRPFVDMLGVRWYVSRCAPIKTARDIRESTSQ